MKQTHLCLGAGCFIDDGFEDLNCAVAIDVADSADDLSLGVGMPGCETPPMCNDGMYEPCPEV